MSRRHAGGRVSAGRRWGTGGACTIVDVTPEAGQSAEFALENTVKAVDTPLLTGRLVRTSDGYGFAVTSNDIPVVGVTRVEATFWGVPADPSHDPMRGRICHSDGRPNRCTAKAVAKKQVSPPRHS